MNRDLYKIKQKIQDDLLESVKLPEEHHEPIKPLHIVFVIVFIVAVLGIESIIEWILL